MEIKNKYKIKIKFALFLFFTLAQAGWADISLAISITAQDMTSLTNKSRIEAGLAPLAINEKLSRAAEEKANDMFKFQYFDHNSPSGTTPWDFIKSTGYEYGYAGENLAIDFISANGAHKALMESSSHRENILNKNFIEIGIAVKEDIFEGSTSIIIVEEFASPLQSEKIRDYSLNKNVELVLEEKANEINNTQKKEEIIIENLGVKENTPADKNENETDLFLLLEEKSINEIDDALEVRKDISNKSLKNVSALYFLSDDAFEKWIQPLFLKENLSKKIALVNYEQEADETVYQNNSILLAENLEKERVMGLVNEASFKEAYLKKFKHQTNSFLNSYLQNELFARVLMLNLFLAILLIIDFWFIVRVNPRNLMPEIN